MSEPVRIEFWVKIVEMLQQNWAAMEPDPTSGVRVYFISDTSGVFDEITFPSTSAASVALNRNGFRRFASAPDLQSFLRQRSAPFCRAIHPKARSIPLAASGDHN
jgi:hypothetical protein